MADEGTRELVDCPWNHQGANYLIAVPKAFLAEVRRQAAEEAWDAAFRKYAAYTTSANKNPHREKGQ